MSNDSEQNKIELNEFVSDTEVLFEKLVEGIERTEQHNFKRGVMVGWATCLITVALIAAVVSVI